MTIFNTFIVISAIILWNKCEIGDLKKLYPESNTTVYDNKGNMIANLSSIYTEYTPYEEIPDSMINAIISIEDSRFFTHKGIDFEAVGRSILANAKNLKYTQGASTITQQLVKNIYLSTEKTVERKINEAILALKLENILTKEDILASYLSNVLFGGRIYGIKMAAKYYFNKEVNELTIKESSLLAGMVQMPNYYNPFFNPKQSESRRNLVLSRMYEEGYITENEYQENIKIPLESYLEKGQINENIGMYASYIDYVLKEAETNYNLSLQNTTTKISINVDSEIQKFVYDIMNNKYNNFPDEYLKCGIVIIDNKTANILAIGGSRETGMKNLNYATDVFHQPASTIKPILSYAPALEFLDYMPLSQILDEPYRYSDGMLVNNWDNRYLGNISLRYALSNSRNVPAIKLYNMVGSEKAWELANRLGLENRDGYSHESLAIGGFEVGFSVLEMTNAYTTFPNMGKYKQASSISSITTGDHTYQNNNEFVRVMSEETAFLINDILHDVLKYSSYDLKKAYLSSKTGQSNYDYQTRMTYNIPLHSTKDSWVIGYTDLLTVGVWIGYDNLKNGYYLTPKTKDITLDIMHLILSEFGGNNQNPYQTPHTLKLMSVDVINGLIYEVGIDSKSVKKDYFYKGFTPLLRENLEFDKI